MLHGSRDGCLPPGKRHDRAVLRPASCWPGRRLRRARPLPRLAAHRRRATGVIRGRYSGSPVALAVDEIGTARLQVVTSSTTRLHRRLVRRGRAGRARPPPGPTARGRRHRGGLARGPRPPRSEARSRRRSSGRGPRFVTRPGAPAPRGGLAPRAETIAFPCFPSARGPGIRPDYDLDTYRRGEPRTTEERFARSLFAEIEAEATRPGAACSRRRSTTGSTRSARRRRPALRAHRGRRVILRRLAHRRFRRAGRRVALRAGPPPPVRRARTSAARRRSPPRSPPRSTGSRPTSAASRSGPRRSSSIAPWSGRPYRDRARVRPRRPPLHGQPPLRQRPFTVLQDGRGTRPRSSATARASTSWARSCSA